MISHNMVVAGSALFQRYIKTSSLFFMFLNPVHAVFLMKIYAANKVKY